VDYRAARNCISQLPRFYRRLLFLPLRAPNVVAVFLRTTLFHQFRELQKYMAWQERSWSRHRLQRVWTSRCLSKRGPRQQKAPAPRVKKPELIALRRVVGEVS
jgi:hypothetical protein